MIKWFMEAAAKFPTWAAMPDCWPRLLIIWLIVVSSGNLWVVEVGVALGKEKAEEGEETKLLLTPPPWKVSGWLGWKVLEKVEEGGAAKEVGVATTFCGRGLLKKPVLWCTFLSKGNGEGTGSLKNALSVAEVGVNADRSGRGEEMAMPLPLRKTNTPCLWPLCRMSTRSLKCVGVALIPRGVVTWSPITEEEASLLTSKPVILRRLLLVRWWACDAVLLPIRAFIEARPAVEMALKMLLNEPELSSLFLDSEKENPRSRISKWIDCAWKTVFFVTLLAHFNFELDP